MCFARNLKQHPPAQICIFTHGKNCRQVLQLVGKIEVRPASSGRIQPGVTLTIPDHSEKAVILSFMKFGTYLGLMLQLCLLGVILPLHIQFFHNYEKYEKTNYFRFRTRTSKLLNLYTLQFVLKCVKHPRCAFCGFKGSYK